MNNQQEQTANDIEEASAFFDGFTKRVEVPDTDTVKHESTSTVAVDIPPGVDIPMMHETKPEPVDFVLPGFVTGTVGSLISPGGTGKSMLALQIAYQIAGGGTLGFDSPTGKVLYLVGEDREQDLHHRIYAMRKYVKDIYAIAEKLDVVPLRGMNVLAKPVEDAISQRAEGSRLIIIDTLRRFHDAEENDGRAMVRVISALENIARNSGAAVLFLHHANKSAALNGQGGEQQAARGSSVLTDNIRWQSFLAGMNGNEAKAAGIADDERRFYVRFGVSKMNYAAPEPDRWFRRAMGGFLVPAPQIAEGVRMPAARITATPRKAAWR